MMVKKFSALLRAGVCLNFLVALSAAAQDVSIVQPGAPGGGVRDLTAEEAIEIANSSYSRDDVLFMQGMIPHHRQAVEMSDLVEARTNREEIVEISGKIKASQADEIKFMRDWLSDRGEKPPMPHAHHGMAMSHKMAGMASPEQMSALAASEGVAFDKMFLELMIRHHEGAIEMVDHLLDKPGSAYDPTLFQFVSDIKNDQTFEIEWMTSLLTTLSQDARSSLGGGFADAEQAIQNMRLVTSLPKPNGFFDPENPADLAPALPSDGDGAPRRDDGQSTDNTAWSDRSPLLSFSNTDMAFARDKLIAGSYHGFNVYQLDADGMPDLYSSVVCPGGQGDVSVIGDLLIMSVEQTRGRVDCGRQGVSEDVSAERFRGLRIFDISDLKRPVQVGQVQTCRGSHTHSIVSGPGRNGKIIVYNSGTSVVRDEKELAGCFDEEPGDNRTALFRIDVIEIPVDDPSKARIVSSPAVFSDGKTGRLAGLWKGGDHGEGTQTTSRTDECHDITVFPSAKIAAGACSGNGIIFDISNPMKPKRIDAVTDSGFAYWHSATFNNDGTKVLFTDEWGGGARPRCRPSDPKTWGANAIYEIKDGKLEFASYFKMPALQADLENCVAHNGSVVPVPGRDIFVQAWYQGGISVMDFTDAENPVEIAYFDRGPVDEEQLVVAGFWSAYWYKGKIYGTEIARGLDVLALEPSEFLSADEIAAAGLADAGVEVNPQQQFPVTWPDSPVVARAYLDQLGRDDAISASLDKEVRSTLMAAEVRLRANATDADLAKALKALAKRLPVDAASGRTEKRLAALSDVIDGMARRLK